MNAERLKRIIKFSDEHKLDISAKVREFYSYIGMNNDSELLNIRQIARTTFLSKGFIVLELPFADEEIGALCYKGDALGYVVLNSSLPKVNVNFAICHELYHVFYEKMHFKTRVEFANDNYEEFDDELAANLFAGMLMMPEISFRNMYHKFKKESEDEIQTLILLMNYYQAPYMAVLIRCYELSLIESNVVAEEFLNLENDTIKNMFSELWLDNSLLEATSSDDYKHIEHLVEKCGREYIEGEYLNERTLNKVKENMKKLYAEIKGE